jgi:hypothetical protein
VSFPHSARLEICVFYAVCNKTVFVAMSWIMERHSTTEQHPQQPEHDFKKKKNRVDYMDNIISIFNNKIFTKFFGYIISKTILLGARSSQLDTQLTSISTHFLIPAIHVRKQTTLIYVCTSSI